VSSGREGRVVLMRFKPKGAMLLVFVAIVLTGVNAFPDTALVTAGSAWRYLDNGSDQGSEWRETTFNDSAWSMGLAQLGYGDGDEATVVGYGPDPNHKYVTTYFRHSFTMTDPSQVVCLTLRLLRDDGAVVYLNGEEIERSNMPAGTIDYLTFASSAVSDAEESTFNESYIYPPDLTQGENFLAVEIHQVSGTSSDISFDLELIGMTELPDLMWKRPYLIYAGTNTEMQALWQLCLPETCAIEWGTDTTYSLGSAHTTEYGDDHQHTYTITGLTPGTKYYYRVNAGNEEHAGSFWSAPPADACDIKFVAYGDTRTYPVDHDQVASGIVSTYSADPAFQSIIVAVGDLVTQGDNESDWDNQFFDPTYLSIQAMLRNVPYQSAMGNHEQSGVLFVKYFPYPFVDGRYWSYDYGPAHFVVVDQYTTYGSGSAQLEWIESDLASTSKPWKFVYLHEPGWSAGGHANNTSVQDYIQPLCEEYGVGIVFAGHNHYYARAMVNDVQHVTTGGGGAPLRDPNPDYPNVVTAIKAHHFCKVEIDGGVLEFAAVTKTGSVIDTFSIHLPGAAVEVGPAGDHAKPLNMLPPYPNPFSKSTKISFSIGVTGYVELSVYDITGQKLLTLAESRLEPGHYDYVWGGRDSAGQSVSPGIYFFRLQAGDDISTRKVILTQ
jgi:hypothetical protein